MKNMLENIYRFWVHSMASAILCAVAFQGIQIALAEAMPTSRDLMVKNYYYVIFVILLISFSKKVIIPKLDYYKYFPSRLFKSLIYLTKEFILMLVILFAMYSLVVFIWLPSIIKMVFSCFYVHFTLFEPMFENIYASFAVSMAIMGVGFYIVFFIYAMVYNKIKSEI